MQFHFHRCKTRSSGNTTRQGEMLHVANNWWWQQHEPSLKGQTIDFRVKPFLPAPTMLRYEHCCERLVDGSWCGKSFWVWNYTKYTRKPFLSHNMSVFDRFVPSPYSESMKACDLPERHPSLLVEHACSNCPISFWAKNAAVVMI